MLCAVVPGSSTTYGVSHNLQTCCAFTQHDWPLLGHVQAEAGCRQSLLWREGGSAELRGEVGLQGGGQPSEAGLCAGGDGSCSEVKPQALLHPLRYGCDILPWQCCFCLGHTLVAVLDLHMYRPCDCSCRCALCTCCNDGCAWSDMVRMQIGQSCGSDPQSRGASIERVERVGISH